MLCIACEVKAKSLGHFKNSGGLIFLCLMWAVAYGVDLDKFSKQMFTHLVILLFVS